jgi:hypothetical protein
MSKLIDLNQEDLVVISNFISSSVHDFIFKHCSKKEITDLDIHVELSYDDELDIDISIDLSFDNLTKNKSNIANDAIDFALNELDSFLNNNYMS